MYVSRYQLTAQIVGRTPWSAADALVGLYKMPPMSHLGARSRPGAGCGPGGPPHNETSGGRYSTFQSKEPGRQLLWIIC